MSSRSLFTAFLLLVSSFSFFANAQSTSSDATSLRGTVIDEKTAQPIAGATVTVRGIPRNGAGNTAVTDVEGGFVIRGLMAGRYRVTASHEGYVDSSRGPGGRWDSRAPTVTVSAGQQTEGITLRLMPTAIISGRVANDRDEAMPGVLVQVMSAYYKDGQRELIDTRTAFTDDRGEFRVTDVPPGHYYIKSTRERGAEKNASSQVFLPTFYPGVTDPEQAQATELHAGEELSAINFTMTPQRGVHVRGRIVNSDSGPAAGVDVVLSQFSGDGFTAEINSDKAGKFDLSPIPAGVYTITAQSDDATSDHSLRGQATVTVEEKNLDVPNIVLFPGASVFGQVRTEGDKKVSLTRSSASLHALKSVDSVSVGSAAVQADGTFVFPDVPDGAYRVSLSSVPDGYYVKRSEDAASPDVVVTHGHAGPVELLLATGAGRIQGVAFRDKDSQVPAASAVVVLVPDPAHRSNGELYRTAATDQSGNFLLRSVPPGSYSLFAWQDIDRNAYMDPNFIAQNEDAGKSIQVDAGSSSVVQLELISDSR